MAEDVTIGGKKAETVPLSLDTLKAPLRINVYETENGFRITCEYDSQHYEEWNIRALLKGTISSVFMGILPTGNLCLRLMI